MLFTKSIIYIGNGYFINLEKRGKIAKADPEEIKQQILAKLKGYLLLMMSKQKNMNDLAVSLLGNINKFPESASTSASLLESIVTYVRSRDDFLIQFIKVIVHEDFYSNT